MQQRTLALTDDIVAVRRLLIDSYPDTPLGWNWEVRRWDGRCFYSDRPPLSADWAARTRLWVHDDGRVVAVVNPEGRNDAHFQLHPAYRHLEPEMLDWAESRCRAPGQDGVDELLIEVQEYDDVRRALLMARGFEQTGGTGYIRRLSLSNRPEAVPRLAAGYRLRTTDPSNPADCEGIAALLNAAFGRTAHTGTEYQNFTAAAPSFRADLDLLAQAPDGSFAAYVGIPYEPEHRLGIFEPVCTHPRHRRKGLARALMLDGLRRLHALGARAVMVGTGDMAPANRLYDGLGFAEKVRGTVWRKRWD